MPFTFQNTDWTQLQTVDLPPGNSANPVLKLVGTNNTILWVKAAAGGERVAFAGETMSRLGYSAGTRVLRKPELDQALQAIARVAGQNQPVVAKLTAAKARLDGGQNLILLENITGQEYGNLLTGDTSDRIKKHLETLAHPSIRQDVARLIAADLLLGNFDRMAVYHNGTQLDAKLHTGNFIYDATNQRFLPIDNDTVAPSVPHIQRPTPKPTRKVPNPTVPVATTADLYRTVIEGGGLLGARAMANNPFPESMQAGLDVTLGPQAADAIYAILAANLPASEIGPAAQKALKDYAAEIVPLVRAAVRTLLGELKAPSGNRVGLNNLMKAQRNVEGMNYSAFKVKCRFAAFLLDPRAALPPDDQRLQLAKQNAFAYGKYRDWKEQLESFYSPPTYWFPTRDVRRLGAGDKASRLFTQGVGQIASLVSTSAGQMKANLDTADRAKDELRIPANWTNERKLLDIYNLFVNVDHDDNRIIKVQVLSAAYLYRLWLTNLSDFLTRLQTEATNNNPVAELYKKAIQKNCPKLLQAVGDVRARLKQYAEPSLNALHDQDNQRVGAASLLVLLQGVQSQLQQLLT